MLELVTQGIACIWGIWSCAVFLVQGIGMSQIFRHCSKPPRRARVESFDDEHIPHVTVIRPVNGLEPALYECLASTFQQTYPRSRLSVHLCVASRADPALPVLERVVADFPDVDARIYIEAEDPVLHGPGGYVDNLGPNPKIRNISRAYREARGDVIWIIDCNVWVSGGVAGRMVDKLFGWGGRGEGAESEDEQPWEATATPPAPPYRPYKFVHQLPLIVDTTEDAKVARLDGFLAYGGGRLDEMFMATSHAKFYSAINTVGIAPCIIGKSNMFRKSHLDRFTDPAQNPTVLSSAAARRGRGIDFFSSYICEDHLIGELLWRSPLPLPPSSGGGSGGSSSQRYRNHGLVCGDLAIQPMADTPARAYVARRVRWLRVRKWTVLLATLVEPGVESLLCCFYAAFALTTLAGPPLSRWLSAASLPSAPASPALPLVLLARLVRPTWTCTAQCWLVGVCLWMAADWLTYQKLHSLQSVEADPTTSPTFVQRGGRRVRRPFVQWLTAWLGRELLALPIWTWAVLLGTTVAWRGKKFRVHMDMSVVEIDAPEQPNSKDRLD